MISPKKIIIFSILILIILLILLFVIRIDNKKNDRQLVVSNTPDKVELNQGDPNIDELNIDKHFELQSFNLKHKLLNSAFASPEYINEDTIYFSLDSSEQSTGYIFLVSIGQDAVQQIYSTKNNKIINSLVGVGEYIFWTEYPRENQKDTPWEIKRMRISDRSVETFRSGISEDEILPPILRVSSDKLTWIEKKIENNIVISIPTYLDSSSGGVIEIATIELDESDKDNREGAFLNIQRPIEDGMLVHQTIFKNTEGQNKKTYELVFYPYDQSPPTFIKEDQIGIVDFTADESWIVICEVGKIEVIERKSGNVKYTVPAKDVDMTFDSPFIMNNKLYFRYSMEQISALDLSNGDVIELTESRTVTSKIYNSGDLLGFSYKDAVDPTNEGSIEFNIIENKE